ncbi:MAG: hypothetical protein CM15mP58_11790 [Burkholderiaceae bacterium]|nr:MAG: hypothetical protein CM15mP58_11790 [Burkholderiaceae bacterium]
MLSAGLLIFLWLFFEKVLFGSEIGTRPLLTLGLLLTLLGTQLLAVGLLGELLIRIYHEPSGRKQYQIKLKINSMKTKSIQVTISVLLLTGFSISSIRMRCFL